MLTSRSAHSVPRSHLIAAPLDGHWDLQEHVGGLVGPLLPQVGLRLERNTPGSVAHIHLSE